MSSLLPNNATPQEVALDLATARIGNVDVPIRTLWDPENCPADILPWLAWAFSVDQWDAAWTDAQKRAIVAAATFVHKRKGTPAAVKEVIELIFGGGDLVEPWQSSDLTPHQFKIVTTGLLASEADYDRLIDLVDASKPVRSWLVAVQIKRSATANLTWAGYTHAATESLIYGRLNVGAEALPLSVGAGYHTANTTEVSPAGVTLNIPDFAVIAGTGYHLSNKTTIDARDPSFAVNGFEPEFVASFAKSSPDVKRWNYYRANGVEVDFSKAFDFARAGSATYVDATGTIQAAAANVPRVGHHVWDGSAWVNEGLLLESEARTNLFINSGDMDGTGWSSFRATFSDGDTAPDGSHLFLLAEASETNANGSLAAQTQPSLAAGTYTMSVFAKAGPDDAGFLYLRPTNSSDFADAVQAWFNLESGSVETVNSSSGSSLITTPSASIQDFGGGVYRCILTFTVTGSVTFWPRHYISDADGSLFATIGKQVQIWGAQLEAGSTPSSYIPTSGATAARAAETNSTDNATYDASAMWGVMKGTEAYADLGTAGQVELLDWRDDADNRITITLDTDGAETGEITLTMVNGGASASVAVDAMTPGINQALSLAWRVTGSEIAISCNGGAAVSAATAIGIPDLSAASIVLEGMGARALITQGTGDIGDTGIEEASA